MNRARSKNVQQYLLTEAIINCLRRKKIIVASLLNSLDNASTTKITLQLLYQSQKLYSYKSEIEKEVKKQAKAKKRAIKKNGIENSIPKKNNSQNDFCELTKVLAQKNIKLEVKTLNKYFLKNKKNQNIKYLYTKIKNKAKKIFQKRTPLLSDFLKILALSSQNKINIWAILTILGTIFRPLRKRRHAAFLYLIKTAFSTIVNDKSTLINGIKLQIAGRVKGKPRANLTKFSFGKVSLTKEKNNIKMAQKHVHTIYGCFGFKLWINYK